ncbi:hypothetical protein GLAREA_05072 [Glarea lozoyensis ATCC 20868]|uniref:Uncharacterized protein n=1 Tax=Glarea lozoyensis (strain ATCC 20868 / MF5171) TaxID=1116229 RepID=S3DDD7_GLAL2|nr:uncharacterized protein GLAREA_05072 [Glarea lozoyensis ATCC 20868]EPE35735.1 hypothetical protein GLAREA_05072 [Glarea lozoyensis ATCC 20868]
MSQLTGLFRQILKKSNHPNILVHNIQLERAKQKYLVQGRLGDGGDIALEIGPPEKESKKLDDGQNVVAEASSGKEPEGTMIEDNEKKLEEKEQTKVVGEDAGAGSGTDGTDGPTV